MDNTIYTIAMIQSILHDIYSDKGMSLIPIILILLSLCVGWIFSHYVPHRVIIWAKKIGILVPYYGTAIEFGLDSMAFLNRYRYVAIPSY